MSTEEFVCMCNKFLNMGIPCSHMFLVFKNIGLKKVPPRYVKNRWTKKTILTPTFEIDGAIVEKSEKMDEEKNLVD